MVERVRNARPQQARHRAHRPAPEVAADDVAAEGQRQAAGSIRPPDAQVDEASKPLVTVGQLAFVDQQSRFHRTVDNRRLNLVEWQHTIRDAWMEQLQREIRRRQLARDGDGDSVERTRTVGLRHHDRPVAVAHACAVRQQGVAVEEVRIGMERDRRHFVAPLEGRAVQALDVGQDLIDLEPGRGHRAAGEAVEHERVVRVRTVGDRDTHV